eukprot:961850-Rhodomonas_salina.1
MSHASADMAHSVSKTAKMAFPPLKFHQPSEQDASAHTQAAHEATKQAHEAALSPGDWTAVPASHDPTNLPLAMARSASNYDDSDAVSGGNPGISGDRCRSVPNKQQRLWGWSIKDMMNFTQPSQAPEHAVSLSACSPATRARFSRCDCAVMMRLCGCEEATKALAAPAEVSQRHPELKFKNHFLILGKRLRVPVSGSDLELCCYCARASRPTSIAGAAFSASFSAWLSSWVACMPCKLPPSSSDDAARREEV